MFFHLTMGKHNNKKKGNNVSNVDPHSNALDVGFTNHGPNANEDGRDSSESSDQFSAVGNPDGSSNQSRSLETRALNSGSSRTPNDTLSRSSGASGAGGIGGPGTANSQQEETSNPGGQSSAAGQHSRVSGQAEGSASSAATSQQSRPTVSTPSRAQTSVRETSTTGHFTALTSALGTPLSANSRAAGLTPGQLNAGTFTGNSAMGTANLIGNKRPADDTGRTTVPFDDCDPPQVLQAWLEGGGDTNSPWYTVTAGNMERSALCLQRRMSALGFSEADVRATQMLEDESLEHWSCQYSIRVWEEEIFPEVKRKVAARRAAQQASSRPFTRLAASGAQLAQAQTARDQQVSELGRQAQEMSHLTAAHRAELDRRAAAQAFHAGGPPDTIPFPQGTVVNAARSAPPNVSRWAGNSDFFASPLAYGVPAALHAPASNDNDPSLQQGDDGQSFPGLGHRGPQGQWVPNEYFHPELGRSSASHQLQTLTQPAAYQLTAPIPTLSSLDSVNVERFLHDLSRVFNNNTTVSIMQTISDLSAREIGWALRARDMIQAEQLDPGPQHWTNTMTVPQFMSALRHAFLNVDNQGGLSQIDRLGAIRFDFGASPERALAQRFAHAVGNALPGPSANVPLNQRAAVNALLAGLVATRDEFGNWRQVSQVNLQLHQQLKARDIKSTDEFIIAVIAIIDVAAKSVADAAVWTRAGNHVSPENWSGHPGQYSNPLGTKRQRGNFNQPEENLCDGKCFGCGRTYHGVGKNCNKCLGHPDRNTEDTPFVQSAVHQQLVTLNQAGSYNTPDVLPLKTRADLSPLSTEDEERIARAKEQAIRHTGGGGHTQLPAYIPNRDSSISYRAPGGRGGGPGPRRQGANQRPPDSTGGGRGGGRNNNYQGGGRGNTSGRGQQGKHEHALAAFLPTDGTDVFPSVAISTPTLTLTVACFFDSGALQGNYVSRALAVWLQDNAAAEFKVDGSYHEINLGGTEFNVSSIGSISFDVTFFNEESRQMETIQNFEATVLDSTFPLIVGRPAIRKYKLARKIISFFEDEPEKIGDKPSTLAIEPPVHTRRNVKALPSSVSPTVRSEEWRQHAGEVQPSPQARHQLFLLGNVKTKQELLPDCDPDIDYIEWPEDPFENSFTEDIHPVEKITIEGSLPTQRKIRDLCKRYEDIFAESVRSEPASVPPMDIQVDLSKWQCSRNRGPPRPQSNVKMKEIEKQIKKYVDLGVIRPVAAAEYSNIHMVPKSTPGEWRFCLDFVQLNAATQGSDAWPIPNIKNMLNRIGSRKSKVFGVMDMTAGYHQTPISAASQIFTAFICYIGIFCWLRVPMGLKNAASYFQRVMATVVLAGVIYLACELYIDDIFVFGEDEDAFVRNLELVFIRLRKHKVTLNPKKCHFGMSSVEYVGHVISSSGITFSEEKRGKVLEFPLPRTQKDLQAFLGLINWFRDHVPDMTSHEKPLRELMDTTKRNFTLTWHEQAKHHFEIARDIVAKCPALYFVDANASIVVMTDASDYGVGAYIYQLIDGKEHPIIFFSKALHGAELNWATIEKEAFAIFLTLTKFGHLLRDNKFLLRTDHKNLTYINAGCSQKVKRWGIALQEFDFDIEHVPGKDNFVADTLSRLVANNQPVKTEARALASLPTIYDRRITDEHYTLISHVHNSTVGHFGVDKTLEALIKDNKKWPRMRKDIRQFIHQCPLCQKLRETHLAIKTRPFTTAAYTPMEVLNIDTIGPLASDNAGNEHILVVIDCFTRWVELFAIPDTSALSAAEALLQHVGRFGAPATLRSDKGSQFVNGIITELNKLIVTHHETTIACSMDSPDI